MEHGNIVGMFGAAHRSGGFIGGAIMVATTWPWRWFKPSKVSSHSSIGFIYSDGYREIFEAREGKSWQGPIPVDKVERWVAENKKRRFTMYDIPDNMISIESMSRKYLRCEAMLTVWTYSMMQLPRMGIRHFIPFLPMKPTPNKVVCSEAATIILGPDVDICRMTGKFSPDRVTPYDYEAALKLLTAKPKHQPADTKDAYNVG